MDEQDNRPDLQQTPPERPHRATKSQRVAAWIGVVLMVLLVLMYTYSLATGAFLDW